MCLHNKSPGGGGGFKELLVCVSGGCSLCCASGLSLVFLLPGVVDAAKRSPCLWLVACAAIEDGQGEENWVTVALRLC